MPASDRAIDLARIAGRAAEDKLASTIAAIDVSEQLPLSDIFVVVSAETERQVDAIVDAISEQLRDEGVKPLRREGEKRWVLIDFGDIVVHVQHEEDHAYYDLERLWKDGVEIDIDAVGTKQPSSDG